MSQAIDILVFPMARDATLRNRRRRLAWDEFKESEHPRGQPGNAGQFTSGSGGGSKKASKKDLVSHMLQKGGVTAKEMLVATGWPTMSVPAQAHAAGLHLTKTKENGVTKYKGTPYTSEQKAAKEAAFKAAKEGKTAKPASEPQVSKPNSSIDFSKLTKIGEQKGSNPGGVYQDTDGQKYYVKEPKTQDHVNNELMAAKLYKLAGVKTLDYVSMPGKVATKLVDLDKNNVSQFDKYEWKYAQSDFAVHAWLANWDAAGQGGDNQGIIDGRVGILDVGGSLKYRAKGGEKGAAFGDKVGEFEGLRDPNKNPDAAKLFGDMTDQQIRDSVKKVGDIPDSVIKKVILKAGGDQALADKLVARKSDLIMKAAALGVPKVPKVEPPKVTNSDPHVASLEGIVGSEKHSSYIKYAENAVKAAKLNMPPVLAAHISLYSNGKYRELNEQLRTGVMDSNLWEQAKSLNTALDYLPPHVGTTYRKAGLDDKAAGLYKVGQVVEERAFTSTSTKDHIWSGDYRFEIHGKTGRSIEKLSSHPGEAEVLFKMGTRFRVLEIKGKSIKMEEI